MTTNSSAPIRLLYCSCCGERAGRWHQHWNMDTGFGACVRCITFLRRRGETEAEILSRYGTEDVNWGMSIQMYGSVFRVVAAFPEREVAYANEWMSKHETHALLAIHEGLLLLADINDRGGKPREGTPGGSPPPAGNIRVFPVPQAHGLNKENNA